jgi:DNA-binding NarL/FixJ family response regulator
MIRVVVCDDQEVVREGLRAIVGTAPGMQVVGVAGDGAEVVDVVEGTRPDVVLMDLNMPIVTGVQATRVLHEKFPTVKVLVLTTYDADEWVFDAIRAGASGYLLKDAPRADLIAAIAGTAAGKTFVDSHVAGKLFSQIASPAVARDTTLASSFSDRERDVLRLLAQGLSNAEIAGRLFLSEGTIRNYVSAIFEKLGVSDRTRAALIAVRHGLVD